MIDGDARSAAIAAASVIAKVTRDRYMMRVAEELPGWHFHTNVGYSTPEHRDAIAEHRHQRAAPPLVPVGRIPAAGDRRLQNSAARTLLDVVEAQQLAGG